MIYPTLYKLLTVHLLQKTFIFFTFLHDRKQIIDDILRDVNDYIMKYKPIAETTNTTIKKKPESLNFKEILLPKRKKKQSLLAASKAIRKYYKKT